MARKKGKSFLSILEMTTPKYTEYEFIKLLRSITEPKRCSLQEYFSWECKKALEVVYRMCNEYCLPRERIFKFWFGPVLGIVVTNPKYIEAILTSPDAADKHYVYKVVELVGNGLFTRNGKEWEELRKPLDKLLTKKMVESNLGMFHKKSIKSCNVLKKYADTGECFNIRHYITNFTLDTVCVSIFGYDLNEIENDNHNIMETMESIVEATVKFVSNILTLLYFPFGEKFSKGSRCMRNLAKSFWKLSSEILQGRLQARTKLGESIDDKPIFYSDVLLQKAKKYNLSWEEAGKLTTDMLVAGIDTSAVTISCILLLLAMNPEHQDAVYREQLEIFGDDLEVSPTWQQLSKMAYLTRVIKEVMRLFGPIGIFRKISNDLDLGGDYKLPQGCAAFILLYYLHRDPTLWSHPNEFYPDHFLPEECAKRPKNTYFPFSWGPRSCPGSVYAMASHKIFISTAIRRYKFETDLKFDKLEYKYSLLLEVSQGYMVKIKPRN
uniref:Uncharacterized protein n=1 Tax=Rhodnius prolixus TaxID=13249 RepID=T1HV77_RHOPR